MFDFIVTNDLARHCTKTIFETVGDHQNAVAARTLCGLFAVYDLAIAVILATCLVFILVLVPARQRLQG